MRTRNEADSTIYFMHTYSLIQIDKIKQELSLVGMQPTEVLLVLARKILSVKHHLAVTNVSNHVHVA